MNITSLWYWDCMMTPWKVALRVSGVLYPMSESKSHILVHSDTATVRLHLHSHCLYLNRAKIQPLCPQTTPLRNALDYLGSHLCPARHLSTARSLTETC